MRVARAARRSWRFLKQGIEPALALEGIEIVTSADMAAADPDLRHGPPAALFHHLGATLGFEIYADALDILYALLGEQALGRLAERAGCGQVHEYFRHVLRCPYFAAFISLRATLPAAMRGARRSG